MDNLVAEEHACLNCGERDADKLEWIMDHVIKCATCGTEYSPLTGGIYHIEPYPDVDSRREDYYDKGEYPPNPVIKGG